MSYSLFIGRFQPLHEGHVALMRKVLDEGKRVAVALRPADFTPANPFSNYERLEMFRGAFPEFGGRLVVFCLPVDIAEVCYGRKVGWGVREIRLDADTEAISATAIREGQ